MSKRILLSACCLTLLASMTGCGYIVRKAAEKAIEEAVTTEETTAATTERPDIQVENYFMETKAPETQPFSGTSRDSEGGEQLPASDLTDDGDAAAALEAVHNYFNSVENRDYSGFIHCSDVAFMTAISDRDYSITDDSLESNFEILEENGYDIQGLMEEKFGDTTLEELPGYIRPATEKEFGYIKQFMSGEGAAYQMLGGGEELSEYIAGHSIDKMYVATFGDGDPVGLYSVHLDGEWRMDCGLVNMIALMEDGISAFYPEN